MSVQTLLVAILSLRAVYGQWMTCPHGTADSIPGHTIQCRNFTLPLDYSVPAGVSDQTANTITFHVARLLRQNRATVRGQVWVINGGPGHSGYALLNDWTKPEFQQLTEEFDVYLPDHRGSGFSDRLTCPGDMLNTNCGNTMLTSSSGRIKHFTTTNAALDLDRALQIVKNEERPRSLHLFGFSYGTYLLNRFMLFKTVEPDTIVMDGVCVADRCQQQQADFLLNVVGERLLHKCADTAECIVHFNGFVPQGVLERIYSQIFTNTLPCNARLSSGVRLTKQSLQNTLASLLWVFDAQVLIPPLIQRIERCNNADVAVLNYALNVSNWHTTGSIGGSSFPLLHSEPLEANIVLSELFTPQWSSQGQRPLTLTEVANLNNGLLFSMGTAAKWTELRLNWPVYTPDQHTLKIAQSTVPLLVMNGAADPATPLTSAAHEAQLGRAKFFVVFPDAPHTTISNTPSRIATSCASVIANSFFVSNGQQIDKRCMDGLLKLDWDDAALRTRQSAKILFNVDSAWGDDATIQGELVTASGVLVTSTSDCGTNVATNTNTNTNNNNNTPTSPSVASEESSVTQLSESASTDDDNASGHTKGAVTALLVIVSIAVFIIVGLLLYIVHLIQQTHKYTSVPQYGTTLSHPKVVAAPQAEYWPPADYDQHAVATAPGTPTVGAGGFAPNYTAPEYAAPPSPHTQPPHWYDNPQDQGWNVGYPNY